MWRGGSWRAAMAGLAAAVSVGLAAPAGAQGGRAADWEGCYVGAEPCGGPARMAALIARCARDPDACGWLEMSRAPRPGGTPARGTPAAPPAPTSLPAPPAAPAPLRPALGALAGPGPLLPGLAGAGVPGGEVPSDARGAPPPFPRGAAEGERIAVPTEARIAVLLRTLPLPEAVLGLSDRMPADPASVERALGLRRPEGGRVIDLRDAALPPTRAEILRALRGGPGMGG